jgi:hypothetical protein
MNKKKRGVFLRNLTKKLPSMERKIGLHIGKRDSSLFKTSSSIGKKSLKERKRMQ